MSRMTDQVDVFLEQGCGRCAFGNTPRCKVHPWVPVFKRLRALLLASGLTETVKWGVPCYTHQSKNVAILGPFREFCTLSFFKGALLKDPAGILEKHGEHSQAHRIVRFTDASQVAPLETILSEYLQEAKAIEASGEKVSFKKDPEPMPAELVMELKDHPALQSAFKRLSPGRQRGYILYFSQPKQSATRTARIRKCKESILQGKGLHDR